MTSTSTTTATAGTTGGSLSSIALLDSLIADLEARLNLGPGESLPSSLTTPAQGSNNAKGGGVQQEKTKKQKQKKKEGGGREKQAKNAPTANVDQPEICKLEFKVGRITKVWPHPNADNLYCEEIDCGEEGGPRQIASGLRKHYTQEQMLGHRVLVVSNLKPRKLKDFKSFGMVLCAKKSKEGDDDTEKVEFIEPPEDAPPGEIVTLEGLPSPQPFSPAQVEKKKVWEKCLPGMRTTSERVAAWDGHAFVTSAGPCHSKTIGGGPMS